MLGYLAPILLSSSHLGPSWGYLGTVLGPSWGHLGVILGASWGHLGAILGPAGGHLGPSWRRPEAKNHWKNMCFLLCRGILAKMGILPTSWAILGPSWGRLVAILGPSRGHLEVSWGPLGAILGAPGGEKPKENACFWLVVGENRAKPCKSMRKTRVFVHPSGKLQKKRW